ncbi:MAG: hypothetical protein AB8F74_13435 [Saprospiraceae bacterium]
MSKSSLIFILLCIWPFIAMLNAQDTKAALMPARPGMSPFPSKLDKGLLALETGVSAFRSEKENIKDLTTQIPLQIRFGLLENLELNLTMAYEFFRVDGNRSDDDYTGLGETSIGAKIKIADEKGIFPRIEFHGSLELPYFGESLSIPDDVEPDFDINFLHNINNQTQLTYGAGIFWRGPDENGFYGMKFTRFMKERHAFFAEHYGLLRGNNKNEFHLGFGYLFWIKEKIQFDIGFDFGGLKETRIWGLNTGLSFLLKD